MVNEKYKKEMAARLRGKIGITLLMLLMGGCIVEYIPKTEEDSTLLCVEGTITDQREINTIVLSKSIPLWDKQLALRLSGCQVVITDDLDRSWKLKETTVGTYVTDTNTFRGEPGRIYTLHIRLNDENGGVNYESLPVRMIPAPPIDTVYYEKTSNTIREIPVQGCNIFLSTYDLSGNCKFYRWKYTETWEFHLPFNVDHKVCWISQNSTGIFIKNSSSVAEGRVSAYPLISIIDPVDRLSVKYSLLVRQYSMNENEYIYWDGMKSTIEQIGGLYDLIPAYVPNNIFCVERPAEKVLGYFSVSAVSARRIFIEDTFTGMDSRYLYEKCIYEADTMYGSVPPGGLNDTAWVVIDYPDHQPPYYLYTYSRSCVDCRTRGTDTRPVFWDDDEK